MMIATLAGLLCLLGGMTAVAADPVRIKLGTLAPKDSTPHQALKTMGEQWRPHAQLTVFTDGTQGGEADMVRRMRIGQLQGALLTTVGLAEIDPAVTALQTMPLVYRTLEEVDYVREKLRGNLEQKLEQKGFVVICWVDAGWVRFFSRRPVIMPDDLRRQKLFAWAGDNKAMEIMKAAGYQPIPLETADILPGLQTGLIDAVPAPPFFALAGQFFGPAPHMLNMNWSPLSGACVVSKKVWDRIPPEAQRTMLAAGTKAGEQIRNQARKEMDESVAAMQKRGLTVHELTPEARAAWQRVAEGAYPRIRGAIVPADMFDEVQRLLTEYRAANK